MILGENGEDDGSRTRREIVKEAEAQRSKDEGKENR